MTNLDSVLKSTDITANKGPCSQSYDFFHSYVGMWELNYKGWVLKNWSFWTLVLEKTLQGTLDSESESHSVVSDSLRPHGLQSTRLLHPWDFPGKSTGVGCHCLLRNFTLKTTKRKKQPNDRVGVWRTGVAKVPKQWQDVDLCQSWMLDIHRFIILFCLLYVSEKSRNKKFLTVS